MGAHVKTRSSRCAFQPRPKKKVPPTPTPRPVKPPIDPSIFAHYQLLLRVFASTFAEELASEDLQEAIQDVKKALFERDFKAAFENEEALGMYAARWSPTRALCYGEVLRGVLEGRDKGEGEEEMGEGSDDGRDEDNQQEFTSTLQFLDIVSLGGGPAELAAYASLLVTSPTLTPTLHLTLLDSAPWATPISRLQTALTIPPTLSKYASAIIQAANAAFLPPPASSRLSVRFEQVDILSLADKPAELAQVVFGEMGVRRVLVTVLFTLNELYAVSRGRATLLLLALTEMLPVGSELLIVDSPGSYSEAPVGKEMRRYPMRLLVEHTLLREERGVVREKVWKEVVETEESVWFRLPEGLEYPIPLENMRYQRMLYRLEKPEKKMVIGKR